MLKALLSRSVFINNTTPTTFARSTIRGLETSTIAEKKGIEFFTAGTPNGQKISIVLEELGIPFTVRPIDFAKNEQKQDWFLKVNPNGRIPAIVDHNRGGFPVFEPGAIFLYLAEHYDKNHNISFADSDKQSQVIQWLFWMNSGARPMQGKATHFIRAGPEKIPYAVTRYVKETKRLYGELENHFAQGNKYLVDHKYSIADISAFTWVRCAPLVGIDLVTEFPLVKKWVDDIESRPAVQKGVLIPCEDFVTKLKKDPALAAQNWKAALEYYRGF